MNYLYLYVYSDWAGPNREVSQSYKFRAKILAIYVENIIADVIKCKKH